MNANRRPNLQPLSMRPMLGRVINEQQAELEKQLTALQRAHQSPGSMDNATIEHVLGVFSETKQLLPIYEQQIAHWRTKCTPSVTQTIQVSHVAEQLAKSIQVVNEILTLATKIKGETNEVLMSIDDVSWGFTALGARKAKK